LNEKSLYSFHLKVLRFLSWILFCCSVIYSQNCKNEYYRIFLNREKPLNKRIDALIKYVHVANEDELDSVYTCCFQPKNLLHVTDSQDYFIKNLFLLRYFISNKENFFQSELIYNDLKLRIPFLPDPEKCSLSLDYIASRLQVSKMKEQEFYDSTFSNLKKSEARQDTLLTLHFANFIISFNHYFNIKNVNFIEDIVYNCHKYPDPYYVYFYYSYLLNFKIETLDEKSKDTLLNSLKKFTEKNQNCIWANHYTLLVNNLIHYKKYKEATDYLLKKIEKTSSSVIKHHCLHRLSIISYKEGNYPMAIEYAQKSLQYTINHYDFYVSYNNIYTFCKEMGNYKMACDYADSVISYIEKICDENKIKSLEESQTKYETEKTKLLLEKKELENKKKQQLIYFTIAGIIGLLILSGFIYKSYLDKKKSNILLQQKNEIIEQNLKIIEAQKNEITDSIRYARRLQEAILPPDNVWFHIFPESFILYLPKDILSGDFYWAEETETHKFLAVADCTGHGVPGAIISIVNFNLLNKAVLEKNITDPGEILNQVNLWLTQALHQSHQSSKIRDGMDVSLCAYNKQSRELAFAGAYNSGYLFKNGELNELKADKQPVGMFLEEAARPFQTTRLITDGTEIIYLFSDGYADQFGGVKQNGKPGGKKFKIKNLLQLIKENAELPWNDQKIKFTQTFTEWKGDLEQTDDVLLIGVRFV